MSVVVLLGPPGVGKGTQAALVAERFGGEHVSTGALLRGESSSGSQLGLKVKDLMARGDLVSDTDLFLCLESHLDRLDSSESVLLLLDGVPRNVSQVGRLDEVLRDRGMKVDKVISLTAPVEELVERFRKRWSCGKCGAVYSFESEPGVDASCSRCGASGKFERRADDGEEAVRHRFGIFREETAPVADMYAAKGLLQSVDALRGTEEVFASVSEALKKIL